MRGLQEDKLYIGDDYLNVNPDRVSMTPFSGRTTVPTQGASRLYAEYVGAGFPSHDIRWQFDLPLGGLDSDDELRHIGFVRATSGYVAFALGKEDYCEYVATQGQTTFYLPRRRRNAPQVLGESTTDNPFLCWVNGALLTTNYEDGPTLDVPADGEVTIARDAGTNGFTMFRIGSTLAVGDVVRIAWPPLYLVVAGSRVDFPKAHAEIHTLTLTEY